MPDFSASAPSRPDSPWRSLLWAAWAIVAAFGTYFCMYAFRKPFTAAQYDGAFFWGMPFKTILVTAQVAGYTVSKFIGIRVIAEMTPARRTSSILLLIGMAFAALVLFGLLPRPWNALALFLNGLPLGMVFGLVLGCLEGRRVTEALTAGLCVSFILADGVVKSVGSWLLARNVPEDWMPALAGALFLAPLLAGVWMLRRLPPPSTQDIAARSRRPAMTPADRRALFLRYAPGLSMLTLMFLILTIIRSLRADFAPEIWAGLGEPAAPSTFSRSEVVVAFGVLVVNGCAVFIRDNRTAFFVSLGICAAGFALLAAALVLQRAGLIAPFPFMVAVGLGMYLPYVAVHTTVFERLLAMTRDKGNIGFLMYIADSFGYLGYAAVILGKSSLSERLDAFPLFLSVCWASVVVSFVCLVGTWAYFATRGRHLTPVSAVPTA